MIRLAFIGKGGAGKSSIAGTAARLLARRDRAVLAIDSDPLPGLSYALGLPPEDRPIPDDVVVEGPEGGPRWVLRPDLDPVSFIERYAPTTDDGVRYLQYGNLWDGVWTLQRPQFAWSQVVRELPDGVFDLVGDLPGGTRQPMFGWARYADLVAIVVEPTVKSLHSATRLANIARADWGPTELLLVANKIERADDVERIAERLDRPVAATIPDSRAILDADRAGLAPLDADPDGDFVAGVGALVDVVEETYRRWETGAQEVAP